MKKENIEQLRYDQMHEDAAGNPVYAGEGFSMIFGSNILYRADIHLGTPYQCNDSRLFIVTSGEMDITVNLLDHHFRPGTVGYFGKGCNIQVNAVTADFAIHVLLFEQDYLVDSSLYKTYYGKDTGLVMTLEADKAQIVEDMFSLLWNIVQTGVYSKDVVVSLAVSMMHYFDTIRHRQLEHEKKNTSRREELFKEFVILVNAHSGRERGLSFYAGKLCITEKHLCLTVKSASNKTPGEWIDRATVANAKVLLRRSDLQIGQIADRMNFPRSSAFSKYFKRHTGMSPQEYREQES